MKKLADHPQFHLLLLLLWAVIGLALRLINLASKPLWTDEFATIVFSLGNSFLSIPLDQVLTADQLLQPLQPDSTVGMREVVSHLLNESNHPPLYFLLTHVWLKLFPGLDGMVLVWAVRSLPAILGAMSIPAIYGLSWLAFRSRLIAHITAAFMAVSPFGIYLAQEARHYTLPILWIIASLACLIMAARSIRDRTVLPIPICIAWVVVNALGLATHFFFAFTLMAEAMVIAAIGLVQSWRERGMWYPSAHWWRIWAVAAATGASGLVWIPFIQDIQDSELTRWIFRDIWAGLEWLTPIAQAIAGWITMLYLLPIQADSPLLMVGSAMALLLFVFWTIPKLYWGLSVINLGYEERTSAWVFEGFVAGSIGLFLGVTYLLNADLTSAFRYNFVYFPGVVILIGVGLSSGWNIASRIAEAPADRVPPSLLGVLRTGGRKTIILIILLSLLGALTVVTNQGYQKIHRPEVVAETIQRQSKGTVLVAIAHRTHGQTGRLMGIAWDLQHPTAENPKINSSLNPLYLLAHHSQQPRSVTASLRKALNTLPAPLDLWLINFQDVPTKPLESVLQNNRCTAQDRTQSVDGYRYRRYTCTGSVSPQ
ncbi:MAG: hypothetical protein MUF49_05710 [Oculatellaceae cyanobacterium Prado106]|nr:hypothetical protein [Oculatellaceae cyanobacterium Prado106]